MSSPVRILCLENDLADAELLQNTVETEGIACAMTRVETEGDFRAALQQGEFDLILADYTLPSFDGLSALKIVRQELLDVPFIFVSGTLGEEVAIEALKMGATDYVFKTKLSRLVPAIHRAMREAGERAELLRSEEILREQANLLNLTHDAIFVMDMEGVIKYWNHGAEEQYGWTAEQAVGRVVHDLLKTVFPTPLTEIKADVMRKSRWEGELVHTKKDGSQVVVATRWSLQRDEQGTPIAILELNNDVTERKRAEEVARRSEKELRDVIETVPAMVWSTLPDGTLDFINRRWEDFTGLAAEAALGWDWEAVVHPDDHARFVAEWRAALIAGQPMESELRLRAATGEYRWLFVRNVPLRDELGKIVKWYGSSLDVHERKRAEKALRRNEAYLAEAQRLAHTGSWAWNPLTEQCFYWSEEMFRIFALDPRQGLPTSETFWQRIHPEDRESMHELLWKSALEKAEYAHDHRIVLPDGTIEHIHAIGHPVLDEAGELVEYVGTAVDVTERKHAEEALRQSEAYLAEAQRLSHTGSWAFDVATGKYIYWSEELFRIFGFDPQEGVGTLEEVTRRFHPEDLNRWKENFEGSLREKVDTSCECKFVMPDGKVKHLHLTRHPVLNDEGEVVQLVGTTMDITERKRAEQELREGETRFRTFVDHAGDALFVYDLEQKTVVDVNREACKSLGYTRQELVGNIPAAYHLDSYQAEMESIAGRAVAGETVIDTHLHLRRDGTVFPVEVHTSLVSYAGRRFLLMVARDISDRLQAEEQRERLRQLEAELAHTNRVTMLGELTASLAHELNQPITGAITSADACLRWLAHEPPDLERARAATMRVKKDGTRAAEIINRLRAFYKKGAPPHCESVNANEVVNEMVVLLRSQAGRHSVSIRTEIPTELPSILADRVQLQQVFMNLMLNAIEAMQDSGGELTIRSQRTDNHMLAISISDTGVGLPTEGADQIFDAFFTTKPQGTGMGLAITRSIVEAHGGRLWASPNAGRGATFHFTLPADEGAMNEQSGAADGLHH
jgi:PAS domain S-box-containing protein